MTSLPRAVGNRAVGVDADERVGDGDVVEVALLLVGEEQVGRPQSGVVFRVEHDDARVGVSQVPEGETPVQPLLTQVHRHRVVLKVATILIAV